MDYDGNDFQGQNLHLTGEESSKFSPVLHPYALPKFDFDESLQGHLRFDSLVENEVFLGIPSQEDNQWIEDFSRGSSRVEFSSSAAESCSISRHNNVWSEATSSESVEMLLKSVGQEDRVPGETIIDESDVGNESGSLTGQMEPNLKQDDSMEDVICSQPSLPPEEFPDNISGLNECAGGEHHHVKCTLQPQEAELSAYGSSSELDSNAVSEKCGLYVTKENVETDRKCDDANKREVNSLVNESLKDKMQEDPSVSGLQIGNMGSSSQNVIASAGELNDQEIPHQVRDIYLENASGLPKDICKGLEEHNIQNNEANMDDQILSGTIVESCTYKVENLLCVASKVESIEEHSVESSIPNFEEPSSLILKEDCDLQIAEECNEGLCSAEPSQGSKCEVTVFSEGAETDKQFKGHMHEESPIVLLGDDSFEEHAIEASLLQKSRGPSNSIEKKENFLGSDSQIDRGTSASSCKASMLSGVNNKIFEQGNGSSTNHMCDPTSLKVACSSAELLGERTLIDNLEGGNDVPGVNEEDSNAKDHIPHPMLPASMQMYTENLSSEQGDVNNYDQYDSFHERGDVKLPRGTGDMGCEVVGSLDGDKRVGPSSSGEGIEGNNMTAHVSEFDPTTGNEPVLDVAVEDTNLESRDTLNAVPLLSGSAVTADEIIYHHRVQKSPVLDVEFIHLDKKVETEFEVPREENLSTLKESSSVATVLDPGSEGSVSEVGKGASHDCAAQIPDEAVDQSVPVVETCNTACESEQATVANEVGQECSEKLEVCPVLCDSTVKQVDDAEAVLFDNHKETAIDRNHEVSSSETADAVQVPNKGEVLTESISLSLVEPCCDMSQKDYEDNEAIMASGVSNYKQMAPSTKVLSPNDHQSSFDLTCSYECGVNRMLEGGGSSADLDKPNCDSPTVISCTELSQSENDQQEWVNEGMVENVPVSEVTYDVDDKVQPISSQLRGNGTSKEERSFTFEVSPLAGLTEGETGKGWQAFPTIQACKISTIVEGSPSTSGGGQMDPKMEKEIFRGTPLAHDGGTAHVVAKGTPERKTRRGSGKAAGKENAKKGNRVKETTPLRQSERGDKACVSMRPPGTGQLKQFEEKKPYGNVEQSVTKPCGVISIPTSNLPDLNTSVTPSVLFQQPFTDLQQVQLRAQIFVYGSLIQGAAPDEACMISAFGPSDGGSRIWESGWRACVERLHGQKSHASNPETPGQSRSGTRAPDQAVKHGSLQSKVLSSPVGRVSSKGTPSPVVNPMIPLSPLWNVSSSCDSLQSSGMPRGALLDYHQTLSPLHSYQTSPMRNFVGHNPSWLSQAPFPAPWVAPQTSGIDVNTRFSALPITETVKLTPVKESSVPTSSGTKHSSSIPVGHSGGASVFAGTSSLSDVKKVSVSSSQHSVDQKARKRKKVTVTEGLGQISLPAQTQMESMCLPVIDSHLPKKVPVTGDVGRLNLLSQSQAESVSAPVVSSIFSTSVAVTAPALFASKSNSGKFLSAVSTISSSDNPNRGALNMEKVIISEETFNKVEQSRLQAEDAATQAALAVSHYQGVWSQLDKKKNSGLISEAEAKLASAAVAIAAAASVAKAAAAAAKIASNAAAQAKLMADEVLVSSGNGSFTQGNTIPLPNVVNNLGKANPASILKGEDGSNFSSSIIVAAREAARRRVEAASAASKHAENLDAIVKAAELAAEAVSQAGKIVAMGDPLPLSELVESGPEGCWKIPQVSSEQGVKSNNLNRDQSNTDSAEEVPNVFGKQSKEVPSDKEMQTMDRGMSPLPKQISGGFLEDHTRVVDGISSSVTSHGKDSRGQRGRRDSDLAKTIGVVPESEIGSRSTSAIAQDEHNNAPGTSKEGSIKEGCLVEVFKDGGNIKAAWFSANVLSLKDGKAYVRYTELRSDEGSGQLKEWVPLEGEGINSPRIRIAHPTTSMRFEGTRKRRRAAVTDYTWCVGDRVDAWIQDCWREGVLTQKNKNDETELTVHFPAHGEPLVVRAWHLRPTLIWKDGEWTEWSSSRGDCSSQGDAPQDKRLKVGSPAIEGKGMDKVSKHMDLVESGNHEESRLLPLSANEKIFNVGKNTREENKLDAPRTMRTGLQKEGSKVIFGVPKPGKKRKFMEVSKHYVTDRSSKYSATNDSVKISRYLMPQGSGSRGWKNNSKIGAKEKQAAESKPKVLKSGKPQNVSGRTLPQNFLTSKSSPRDDTIKDHIVKNSVSNDKNGAGQQNLMEFGSASSTEKAAEGPILVSLLALPPDAPPKKVPSTIAKSERLNKVKPAPAGGKSAKAEVKDKSIPEVVEPRRSNRRIQPTSRLLEGLQSSLIIPKMPAVPSHRSQNTGTSRGNNNHG